MKNIVVGSLVGFVAGLLIVKYVLPETVAVSWVYSFAAAVLALIGLVAVVVVCITAIVVALVIKGSPILDFITDKVVKELPEQEDRAEDVPDVPVTIGDKLDAEEAWPDRIRAVCVNGEWQTVVFADELSYWQDIGCEIRTVGCDLEATRFGDRVNLLIPSEVGELSVRRWHRTIPEAIREIRENV